MAIELKEVEHSRIIELRTTGEIMAEDLIRLAPAFKRFAEQYGQLNVLLEWDDFHGLVAEALTAESKFEPKHFAHIARFAIVGDTLWRKEMTAFCTPFTMAQIRFFTPRQRRAAREWLTAQPKHSTGVAVFPNHQAAETAVKELQRAGFDLKQFSIVGRDYHSENHVVGYYNTGDRMQAWGKMGPSHPATLGRWTGYLSLATAMELMAVQPLLAKPEERAITDTGVTSAVKSDLQFAKDVSENSLHVKTSQGIVTLSGTTSNLRAKDRAAQIAKCIRGVRGVINEITVNPISRPDEAIRRDILLALLQYPATETYRIDVSVRDGAATLSGKVGTWAESKLAAKIAEGVKGLKAVNNNLVIAYTNPHTDSEINSEIAARIKWDAWLAGDAIKADVHEGKVTLTGKVGSLLEKSRAFDDAWVRGTENVNDSNLQVDPAVARLTDRKELSNVKTADQLKRAVLAAFKYDPRLKGSSPDVVAEDGIVVLTGKVTHLRAREIAEQDARNTVGVLTVDNQLMIDAGANLPGDGVSQKALKAAIAWDPMLEGSHIEGAVIDHVAYLSGTVESPHLRAEAQNVAAGIKGVVEVRNHLDVEPRIAVWSDDWPNMVPETFGQTHLKSDDEIKAEVEKALFWSPFVHRYDLNVSVDGGVVMLTGKVGSWIGYEEAYQDARKSGATSIVDKVHVAQGAWF